MRVAETGLKSAGERVRLPLLHSLTFVGGQSELYQHRMPQRKSPSGRGPLPDNTDKFNL